MSEYDVIVVGGGPAGSSAAKAAAERGARTILLEEHTTIGVPMRCSGGLFSPTKPDIVNQILRASDKYPVLSEYRAVHVFAPSGKLVKEVPLSGKGCYLVDRALLDKELARQAVNAGADLFVNTRVTGLLKQDGRVIGVTTSAAGMPEVYGKIVIAADGMYGTLKGIAKWEGLARANQTFTGGISMELTRVHDLDPDVIEFHCGAFTPKGSVVVWPRDAVSCITYFTTLAEFEQVKNGDYLLSRKLKDSVPLRMEGCRHASDMGVRFPEIVKDGLILTGSAANWRGIIPAVVTGLGAGEVAAEAAQGGDVSAKKLSRYTGLCEETGGGGSQKKGFIKYFPFYQRSDQDIEKLLMGIIERDEFDFP